MHSVKVSNLQKVEDLRFLQQNVLHLQNQRLTQLNQNIYIRNFFGVLLILSFTLSNTPTKYLHWLFANHKDFISKTLTDSNTPQINAPGIDCHCETNVVIAPYMVQPTLVIASPVAVFFDFTITGIQKITFSKSFSFGLRGPPSIG